MSDDIKNKEESKVEKSVSGEVKAQEPKQEAKSPEKPAEKLKKEKPTNCIVCNKAYKHKRWYYKNGKYFCSKRCWMKLKADLKAKAAQAKESEAKANTEQPSA